MRKLITFIHKAIVFILAHCGTIGIKIHHAFIYYQTRGHLPNFKHPKDLSEKLLSSMHKKSFLKFAEYADKVKVRDFVKAKGLEEILLTHYGVWENAEDINFEGLPESFALKTNNGSGGHKFCKNKWAINRSEYVRDLNEALKLKESIYTWEPHYKQIQPLIFCEELIDTGSDSWPTDYKFTCLNGRIVDVFVAVEREKEAKFFTFDQNWNILPYIKKEYLPSFIPKKPNQLAIMIEIAMILAEDFDLVRVDLYEHKDKVFFGELTFSPWGGFLYPYTDNAIRLLGAQYQQVN